MKIRLLIILALLSPILSIASTSMSQATIVTPYDAQTGSGDVACQTNNAETGFFRVQNFTVIGNQDCEGAVVIPDGVTAIGSSAFDAHPSDGSAGQQNNLGSLIPPDISSLSLPSTLTSIGSFAFRFSTSLETLTIPSSVRSIGIYAFYNLPNLRSLTIQDGITTIEDNAFAGMSSLTSLVIPNSVTTIGGAAFYGMTQLETLTISNGITVINDYTFYEMSSLTSLTIPNGVTNIGGSSFMFPRSLTSLTIPNSVESIGQYAFFDMPHLISLTIPNSVTSIGNQAFYNMSALTSLTLSSNTATIGDSTFNGLSSLTSLIIPNGVTSIGNYTFYGMNRLETLTIPSSLTSIGSGAFNGMSILRSLTIPHGVTSIDSEAFKNMQLLETLTVSSSVTNLGLDAFAASTNIQTFNYCGSLSLQAITDAGIVLQPTCSITAPDSPTAVSAVVTGAGAVALSFTAPINDGGSAIVSYTATSSPGGVTKTVEQSGSGTISFSGLDSGTAYSFTVVANNWGQSSTPSSASNIVTTPGVPRSPTGVSASLYGRTATVSYIAPADNGGAQIISYTAVSTPGGITGTVTGSSGGAISVNGLIRGTSYQFSVVATNSFGDSLPSESSPAVNVPYGAPVNIAIESGNNQSAVIENYVPSSLLVRVTDADGDPVPNVTVSFTGDGVIRNIDWSVINSVETDASGIGTLYSWTMPSIRGVVSLTATVSTQSGPVAVSFTATALREPAAYDESNISVSLASILANGVSTSVISVQARTTSGSYIREGGDEITFQDPSSGSIGPVTDNGDGTYTAIYTSGTTPSDVQIIAEANGDAFSYRPTIALTDATGIALKLNITRNGQGAFDERVFITQPEITVQDVNEDVVTGFQGLINYEVTLGSAIIASGSISEGVVINGVARPTDFAINGTPGMTYTVTYTSAGLIPASQTIYIGKRCDGVIVRCLVGDMGPGGGIVFYVATDAEGFVSAAPGCTEGCRYLEAAIPTEGGWSDTGPGEGDGYPWSENSNNSVGATSNGFGRGYGNTSAAIGGLDAGTTGANSLARSYRGGGKEDWYLPELTELIELFAKKDLVGLFSHNYWSSTETSATQALVRDDFEAGSSDKNIGYYARPIRAFAGPAPICYVVVNDVITDGSECAGDLVIDNDIIAIGPDAFMNNGAITSVVIGNSVQTIGERAFHGDNAITSLSIGNSVRSIGPGAFFLLFQITELVIPDSVQIIGAGAFANTFALRSLTLGNGLHTIEDSGFRYSSRLETITFGSALRTIGAYAFEGDEGGSLTSLVIPSSVTSIGAYAFRSSSVLTSLTISSSVQSIGADAFFNADALLSYKYCGTLLTSINLAAAGLAGKEREACPRATVATTAPKILPNPRQQSKVLSINPATGIVRTSTPVVISGEFIETIKEIKINGVALPTDSWKQTKSELSFIMPGRRVGTHSIQISNGSSPALELLTFTFTSIPDVKEEAPGRDPAPTTGPENSGSTEAGKPLKKTLTTRIFFNLSSSALTKASANSLRALANRISGLGTSIQITVTGYAQPTPGSERTDLALSKNRAASVAAALKRLGVNTKITYLGAGRALINKASSRYVEIVASNR